MILVEVVLGCSCVAAMDAIEDLRNGHFLDTDLNDIWRSTSMMEMREQFRYGKLNPTCDGCNMYRNLDLYRSREGKRRAELNCKRRAGIVTHRESPDRTFAGG